MVVRWCMDLECIGMALFRSKVSLLAHSLAALCQTALWLALEHVECLLKQAEDVKTVIMKEEGQWHYVLLDTQTCSLPVMPA